MESVFGPRHFEVGSNCVSCGDLACNDVFWSEAAMGDGDFRNWLDDIGRLSREQRGEGFRALALVEATDVSNPAGLSPSAIAESPSATIADSTSRGPDAEGARTPDV